MARKRSTRSPTPVGSPAAAGFVLDCSVALSWFFADEASDYADGIAAALADSSAVVPSLWHVEVANCLLVGERRRRCTEAQSNAFLQRLAALPISIVVPSPHNWSDIVSVGRQHALSAYDAAYLELAMRRGLPLATLDTKLVAVAKSAGVATFKP